MIGTIDNLLSLLGEFFQKKEILNLIKEAGEISGLLWERGWAERNAGNFSINISEHYTKKELEALSSHPFFPLQTSYPALSGQLFLVSGAGTRMRRIARHPAANVCFLYMNETGAAYHIVSVERGELPVKPTSELATHLAVHQALRQKNRPEKALLHAHVTELIALTQLSGFDNEERLNEVLFGMHPEAASYISQTVGYVGYQLPGTEKLARATAKTMTDRRVVLWEKHGCLAVNQTLTEAFDDLDLLAKSARIYFLCKSTGTEPQGLTPAQIEDIRNQE